MAIGRKAAVRKATQAVRRPKKKRLAVRSSIATIQSREIIESNPLQQVCVYPENASELCKEVFGYEPKEQQEVVVQHIGRGEDCILIAGCGWGKTLTYFLPLVLWRHRVIVVISPLIALMEEQHRKLLSVGIKSVCIHSRVSLPSTLEGALSAGEYRAVFMSPETIFGNDRFVSLWEKPGWRSRVQAVVIDEAHCISTWGADFRTDYALIGDLRCKVPPGVAFIAVSATLHGRILDDVIKSLHFSKDVPVVRANTDRPNVRYEVWKFKNNNTCIESLDFLLDFKKSIVYFDSTATLVKVYKRLLEKARTSNKDPRRIGYYYAGLTFETKELYMSRFRKGQIRILLSTEAAGMGCDIDDIIRVVQVKCPTNITTLAQRLGRAARSSALQGIGILIVLRSTANQTAIDHNLRDYINTDDCRRKIFNRVFDNEHEEIDNCCDVCDSRLNKTHADSAGFNTAGTTSQKLPSSSAPKRSHPRSQAQKLEAKELIEGWRRKELSGVAGVSESYVLETIMDDGNVDKLSAKIGRIPTYDSIDKIIDWSEWIVGSKKRLVDMLVALNDKFDTPPPKDTDNPPSQDVDNLPLNLLDCPLPEDLGDGFNYSSSDDNFQYFEYSSFTDIDGDIDETIGSDFSDTPDSPPLLGLNDDFDYPPFMSFDDTMED
jgi:RecQ family ATP-dependent DNA helicase